MQHYKSYSMNAKNYKKANLLQKYNLLELPTPDNNLQLSDLCTHKFRLGSCLVIALNCSSIYYLTPSRLEMSIRPNKSMLQLLFPDGLGRVKTE